MIDGFGEYGFVGDGNHILSSFNGNGNIEPDYNEKYQNTGIKIRGLLRPTQEVVDIIIGISEIFNICPGGFGGLGNSVLVQNLKGDIIHENKQTRFKVEILLSLDCLSIPDREFYQKYLLGTNGFRSIQENYSRFQGIQRILNTYWYSMRSWLEEVANKQMGISGEVELF